MAGSNTMGAIRSSDDDREGRPSDALRRAVGVVIAVKDLTAAKSRLASEFSGADRTRLVLAMFVDTVTAAGSVSVVDSVTVVTPDPVVADTARQIGARVLDEPSASGARDPEARLNAAFSAAAAALRVDHAPRDRHGNPGAAPADRIDIVALQADLPALRPAELAQAYATAVSGGRSVVVDHHGTGTAALILKNSADELAPLFGSDSARRHTLSGARPLDGTWPGLRLDVDTVDDVRRAHRLGVGPETTAVLRSLGWSDEESATTA
ncbi:MULTISPECIES: 2-phospho-L-lactate guanylyltransferase [Nocardiaceae]|uniref:2-phospho-L-lactate guanylyltransferase n=1 Tax=Nocardiaceae TaxID=85025 RepID=UPI0015C67D73|nr:MULTISPECIES: 2-phospho-L-lactate guanylyltransferase [Rhodococcus]